MKKAVLIALLLAAVGVVAMAQTVNVTFVCNTASVSDTITNTSSLTVTGDAITSWGAGTTLTNIGGDYWQVTIPLASNQTIHYKYRLNGGWENGFTTGSGNRETTIGTSDTTLPLVFYNAGPTAAQDWRPWGTTPDTMRAVYFRVNTLGYQSQPFTPGTDLLGVRGDQNDPGQGKFGWGLNTPGPSLFQWGTTHYLTREGTSGMPGYIYSGVVLFPKSVAPAGDSGQYKFIIADDWGKADGSNRMFTIPATAETTLAWVWMNNEAPVIRNNADTVTVTFIANMTTATSKQSFKLGDTVTVQAGFFGTADSTRTVQLVKQGGTQNYAGQITMVSKLGALLDYQYYVVKNGISVREYYFNFGWSGVTAAEAERRQILLTTKTQTVTDNVVSVTDARRQPYFENQTRLKQQVTVRWEVNVKPAYYAVKAGKILLDGQGTMTVSTVDSIKPWGAAMSGPTNTLVAKDWPTWGRTMTVDTVTQMWDDGTNGDLVANDTIYTKLITYDTTTTKGKTFKFGIGGGDNESGYGLNHLDNVDDTNPTYTLHTQFGSINPNFYSAWDFTNERPAGTTGVIDAPVPTAYTLSQNFPNPFNPSTKIEFAIPMQSRVTLKVYNVLGQVVATLMDGMLGAGTHQVTFDASKIASGVYFYRLEAGSFTSMKKMMLLK
jgi:hypothetical protein